ncbi:MAG: hypothetical protein D8M59_14135 [Planctomycetes bacterium]|nr:hypothetical protein [Planctomycetota bacterium]NOG55471.1 hypothetical protein [Planctomycetota bacterium]
MTATTTNAGRWACCTKGLLAASLCLAGLCVGTQSAEASRRQIKFTNKTGKAADDLHIVIKEAKKNPAGATVEWADGATTPFPSERGVDGGYTHNLYGASVPSGGIATVTLTSDADTIILQQWWWTQGGNALKDGKRISNIGKDNGGCTLTCSLGPAAGDGMIWVSSGGIGEIFMTMPGAPPEETAMQFQAFLDDLFFDPDSGFDFIHSVLTEPNQVTLAGNVLGYEPDELTVEILAPDSQQLLEHEPLGPDPLQLDLDYIGTCPGFVTLSMTGGLPGDQVAFVYGMRWGEVEVPMCPGVWVGIAAPKVAGVTNADETGTAELGGNVPAAGCNRVYVQAIDITACQSTNVALIE